MSRVTPEINNLYDEVYKDVKAFQLLQQKAKQRQSSLTAVLRIYGDPRKWDI